MVGNITTKNSELRNIELASDNVTTINYTSSQKTDVSSIVQSSEILGLTATETYNNAGETTLVITRVIT